MTIFFCAPDRWFVRKKMHSIKADDLNYCLVQTALGYQLGYNVRTCMVDSGHMTFLSKLVTRLRFLDQFKVKVSLHHAW
jgi:hypothetical protein